MLQKEAKIALPHEVISDKPNSHASNVDRRDARIRYEELRTKAARKTESLLVDVGWVVRLRPISKDDVDVAATWKFANRKEQWTWAEAVERLSSRSRQIGTAVDAGDGLQLSALFLGRVSDARMYASLHYMQRDPDPANPLKGKVRFIANIYLQACAAAFGCHTVRLRGPVVGMVTAYNQLGYHKSVRIGKMNWLEQDLSSSTHHLNWNGVQNESDFTPSS